jgi:hypothetical protein
MRRAAKRIEANAVASARVLCDHDDDHADQKAMDEEEEAEKKEELNKHAKKQQL